MSDHRERSRTALADKGDGHGENLGASPHSLVNTSGLA